MSNIISNFFSGKPTQIGEITIAEKKNTQTIPQDSMLKRHFLTQLRADIENSLTPDVIEPNLKHYYEAAIAAEFQKRLAEMA